MSAESLPRSRRTGAFERRIARAVAPLLQDAEHVVVACSGGPDSTAALVSVTRALGVARVTAAHFDHRLRDAAQVAEERAMVEALADCLGVTFVVGRAARVPAVASEDAAREARYAWLARACTKAGATACVTGHTQDDQAETVLLRLARGTAAAGAAGMASDAPWPVATRARRSPRLLRPLLEVSRADVEAYLDALGLAAALDPSNAAPTYARNRVRLQVMPPLREVNPRAAEHLARFAAHQREDDDLLASLAREWLAAHARFEGETVALDRGALRSAEPPIGRRAVWLAAERIGIALESAHVDAILRAAARRGAQVHLPGGRAGARGPLLELDRVPLRQ